MLATAESPLYRQLAAHYEGAMEQGALAVGVRMPSVRELMRRHDVSLSTALQALRHLEELGRLEARPRVGYFVSAPRLGRLAAAAEPDLRLPMPLAQGEFAGINERISAVLEQGRRARIRIDLGSATPAAALFDAPLLSRTAAALLREQPGLLVENRPTQATHPEFQTVMARRALETGLSIAPRDILATYGNSQAVTLALAALAQPGDVIAVESPTYYALLQAIEVQGLQALEIPSSPRTGISLEALELAIRTQPRLKAVVVNPHLQTPLGCVMPDEAKERLVALCREHELPLIEDDSLTPFLETPAPRPAKAWDTTGIVIYCLSLNKTLAPGLRQGWMNAGRWHARVQVVKFAQTRNAPAWGQLLAARYMALPAYDRQLQRIKTQLRLQREKMAQAVARHFPQGTRLSLPPGGVSLWLELPQGLSSMHLFEQALQQKGIRISPGPLFSNTGRYDRFLRLSCGMPFTPEVEQACADLGQLAQRLANSP